MTRTMILVSSLGLMLGCQSPSDRAARHEEKAADQREQAREDLAKGRENADNDLQKAREEDRRAQEERAKIEPVAGRDETLMVRDSLKDKLGDDWTIEKSGMAFKAVRKSATKAEKDMTRKVNEEMKSLSNDQKNVTASYTRGEIILRGQVDDCADVGKTADKFAKIDGVNKIVTEVSCNKK